MLANKSMAFEQGFLALVASMLASLILYELFVSKLSFDDHGKTFPLPQVNEIDDI